MVAVTALQPLVEEPRLLPSRPLFRLRISTMAILTLDRQLLSVTMKAIVVWKGSMSALFRLARNIPFSILMQIDGFLPLPLLPTRS
jgi:hypothetical protein